MSDQELLKSIIEKLDALIEETFRNRKEKYNLKGFLAQVRISRYRLYKLYDEGYLSFNPEGKRQFCYQDVQTVNSALEHWKQEKRA